MSFFIIRHSEVSEIWNSLGRRPTVFSDCALRLPGQPQCLMQFSLLPTDAHCKGINGFPQTTVSRMADFPIWRPSLAIPVSRFGNSSFLWGYLKERVQTKPRTLQELKDSIRTEILSIQKETLTLVMECVASTALCGSLWRSLTTSDFQDIICEQSPTCALSFPPYIFCKSYFFLSVLLFEIQSWLLADSVLL
jgi:hypothetical protein